MCLRCDCVCHRAPPSCVRPWLCVNNNRRIHQNIIIGIYRVETSHNMHMEHWTYIRICFKYLHRMPHIDMNYSRHSQSYMPRTFTTISPSSSSWRARAVPIKKTGLRIDGKPPNKKIIYLSHMDIFAAVNWRRTPCATAKPIHQKDHHIVWPQCRQVCAHAQTLYRRADVYLTYLYTTRICVRRRHAPHMPHIYILARL